jgi:pimeloyl-ACP methyl ester carboxylesterase
VSELVHTVEEWQQRGRLHTLAGHEVFVIDEPAVIEEAEPVLVLHGFPTSSYDWHHALDGLRARRRVVLLDYPGYGLSAKPDMAYSLFAQAEVVEACARELGLRDVALVTHDVGDSIGGELLARELDGALGFHVTRRVLTNGSIYMDLVQLSDGQKFLLGLPDEALPVGSGLNADGTAAGLQVTFAPQSAVDPAELAAMAELVIRDGGGRILPRMIRYVEERRVHERRWTGAIESHPAPLHVIWGDLDPIAVWPMAERLANVRPDATVDRLDGVGHYPMVEAPARFNAALEAALA